jgi:FkbM family methyltransferase
MHPVIKLAGKLVPPSLKQRLKEDLERYLHAPSMELSLKTLRHLGFQPSTIIDVGAYIGEWSLLANKIFPEASILMIEAQESKSPALGEIARAHPGRIRHRIALIGPEARENVAFRECDAAPTGSSVLPCREALTFREAQRRMETLDSVLSDAGISTPDLLKLDVQGYELEVLKGAAKAFAAMPVILMEVSTIELYEGAPLIHEVITFMRTHGYRLFDVPSLMRHRSADTLVQLDAIFVNDNSALVTKAIERL